MADEFKVMEYTEDYPPVFFRENGKPKGIVPDVLTRIGALTGDSFVYVKAPFPRLQLMFDNGEIDIEPSVNPSWRKDAKVHGVFTIPYGESVNAFVFPDKKSVFECESPKELGVKVFGMVRGYNYQDWQPALESGTVHTIVCHDEAKLMELLSQHRIDVAIIHRPFAHYQIKKQPAYRDISIGRPFSQLAIMMRFHPTKKNAVERFNVAIRHLIESGKIKRIYAKYR